MSQDLLLVEKALISGHWDPKTTENALAQKVVEGKFLGVLTSPEAKQLFSSSAPGDELSSVFSFTDGTDAAGELVRLNVAVACLHTFVQANWTGPDLEVSPSQLREGLPEEVELNARAISELAVGGEPAYHLAEHPVFLRLAQLLLGLNYQYCASIQWWRLRATLVHQEVLDEPVPTEGTLVLEAKFGDADLEGQGLLERGLLEHLFAQDKLAGDYFVNAARTTGLQYELTGALGRRTKFQENDLSQLILLAESRARDTVVKEEEPITLPETIALNDDTLLEKTAFTSSQPFAAESKLAHLDPSSQPPLHPIDQCILLSMCLNVRNTSPLHGLTGEQMTPYIARVISHPLNWSVHTMALLLRSRLEASRTRTVERSTLQLQALVDQMPTADSSVTERLLYFHSIPMPSKWAMERELAIRFLTMGVVKSALEIFERLEMYEEVVKCWQSLERTDKAVKIVTDLLEGGKTEADEVLSRGKATSVIRRAALGTAREAKLWCLLGDLEPQKAVEHYEKAWTVSGEKSGRAMRSLGGNYFARGLFAEAIPCLRKAVAINPLLTRSWFILGCAYVRMENWIGGREAFQRCVSIDDEDGESWNNLASMYLRMGVTKKNRVVLDEDEEDNEEPSTETALSYGDEASKSIPFENKLLAFRALKQGLRFAYENWKMWSNYMIVCMDVGELSEACRAMGRIVEETSNKVGSDSVDEDVLDRLIDAVTRAPADEKDAVEGSGIAVHNPNEGHGLHRRVLDLLERTILPRVSSHRIFRAYGRLLTWQSRWADALAAHLNGYRCSIAGTMEKGETDVERWREAVTEVEEIVDVIRNFGGRIEGGKWKLQARSVVRTFMGRTKENFEDEPEWSRLVDLQEELKNEE